MCTFTFHLDCVGSDTHFLLNAADLQGDIEVQLVVHFHHDLGRSVGTEPRSRDGKRVGPGWQGKDSVGAIRSRNSDLTEICLRIRSHDASAGHDRLGTIANHAQNGSGYVGAQKCRDNKRYQNQQKR